MPIEHFSSFVGEKYKPCDVLIGRGNISVFGQSYVIGWKNEDGIRDRGADFQVGGLMRTR